MTFPTEKIIHDFKLFWQYPVITEKTFFEQNKNNHVYIGFPWATIIDKRYDLNVVCKILRPYINRNLQYYTCCQHISFRKLFNLFQVLNINLVYSPHKIIGEDKIKQIAIKSCPLYAANIEDTSRNLLFRDTDVCTIPRKYLYSFQGAYNPKYYLTDIRNKILFTMKHPDNCFVKYIGDWHYERMVYSNKQNVQGELNDDIFSVERTKQYNQLLLDSRYSLCPSGTGPNSIRFWESLASGSIPVLLSDTLELPAHELWDNAIIRIPESKVEELLLTTLMNIRESQEKEMRGNCIKLYKHFKDNYLNVRKSGITNSCATIFTSYKCDIKEPIVQKILNKWKLLNPTINVLYFSDDDVHAFFKDTKYYDVYKNMRNGVAIADFFRICYINKYGGYWFDLDISPLRLDLPLVGNIHLFDCGYKNISYMFIGGKPNQTLFNEVINVVIDNIKNNITEKKDHVMEITGPRIIQNIIFDKLKIKNKDGCFPGNNTPTKYLTGTEYEFTYTLLQLSTTKTNEYKILQKKYNQLSYGYYNYI